MLNLTKIIGEKVPNVCETDLFKKISNELSEDLERYDGDYDEWSEVVLDCPSNTLEDLLGQIPPEEEAQWYREIRDHINYMNGDFDGRD